VRNAAPAQIAWRFLCQHKRRFSAALAWRVLFVIVPMQVPVLTGAMIDGLTHEDVSVYGCEICAAGSAGIPRVLLLALVGVVVVYGVAAYGQMMASHRLSRAFVTSLRKAVARKTLDLSLDQVQHFGGGDLMDRTLTDTANLRRFMERVCVQSLINVLRVIYPVAMLLAIDPALTLVVLSVLVPQELITRLLQRRLHRATQQSRRRHASLTGDVKESIDGVETVKSLCAEEVCVARIERSADALETDELEASRYSAAISGTVFLTTSLGIALTWWQGGQRVLSGDMTLGALVVFTGFVAFAYQPFRQFTTMLTTYRRGLVSLERIEELLTAEPQVTRTGTGRPLRVASGRIEFHGVAFRYVRQPVLAEINLVIEPRELTVVMGRSGSGKSSLLRLMVRLHDPQQGAVLIDGQDLRDVNLQSLRTQVAVVPQQPVLFSGTIRQNICLGRPDAPPEEVTAACQAAGAMELIARLDDGLEARLGRGGVRLSGGEAQRVSIARALLLRPQIILMDEPTSALDATSECAILAALERLRGVATVVIVAHRASTIRSADRVVVLDAGRVVAAGPQADVRRQLPLFRQLVPNTRAEAA
jgi:ABC-type multidrug transport system fused ATPase/permease subunit